jgi:4-hydroxy-tetrahydrodipicolinate reductase
MIETIVCGALGKMGKAVAEEISCESDLKLAGAVEAPGHPGTGSSLFGVKVSSNLKEVLSTGDVVVDFTNPQAAISHILDCAEARKRVVVGTTGLSPEQLDQARKATDKIPILISPNMSLGVNLLFKIVEGVASALPDFDVEIVEIHHNRKKDSPSGTAARLAEVLDRVRPETQHVHGRKGLVGPRKPDEIGVHSLRGGDVVGEHTVIFAGEGERFELTHRAHSRRTFARGALRAIRFIIDKEPGLYTMSDVLGLR